MKQIIPVFFSVNDDYAPYLAVAIHSIVQNASVDPGKEYHIIIQYQSLSQENMEKLGHLMRPGFQIRFDDMETRLAGISDKRSNRLRCDYYTKTIYFRLFIPAMYPEYDKGIYMDSDIVVPGNISELYNVDLEGNLIGACIDIPVQKTEPLAYYVDKAVGIDHTLYFNSGVLLMDMKALRKARLDERFLELMNTWHFDSIAPDQDYLNAMCFGKVYFLDPAWDVLPDEKHRDQGIPKLIHYNLFAKPWCYDNIQYEEVFWEYAKDSGYYEELMDFKKHYSQEKKAADARCQEEMVERAFEIIEEGIPFSSVFNTGKEKRL